METIYLQNGETMFSLANGVIIYYYNDYTPIIFKYNNKIFGRMISNSPFDQLLNYASICTSRELFDYFNL
jgi:hypothetical protein